MPLIVMCGMPCSGKSLLANKLNLHFNETHFNSVLISDENQLNVSSRNALYSNASKEKQLRAELKSQTERHLNSETLVIIDASNYIKGYRYELYCLSKERKTTHCIVECVTCTQLSFQRNLNSDTKIDRYDNKTFDALVGRYEAPDSRNRWDSPLFAITDADLIPYQDIVNSLYSRHAPPPNQSTQCQPLTSTNFVYELDQQTQQVVKQIVMSVKNGNLSNIAIPKAKETINLKKPLTIIELNKLRRQFISYTKMHPISDNDLIVSIFVQYLNKSI